MDRVVFQPFLFDQLGNILRVAIVWRLFFSRKQVGHCLVLCCGGGITSAPSALWRGAYSLSTRILCLHRQLQYQSAHVGILSVNSGRKRGSKLVVAAENSGRYVLLLIHIVILVRLYSRTLHVSAGGRHTEALRALCREKLIVALQTLYLHYQLVLP